MSKEMIAVDANEAVAAVAHKCSEVIAIYPITPSSPMAEHSDVWSSKGRKNIWGNVPRVVEMQSEGGAVAALHGSLQAGALTTTFTASQGLLLMIPNMYKIAGELSPAVFHVSARSIAAQGLSIFGDHGDVMAVRQTGWILLASTSGQEAQDFALISHAATLKTRIPILHFFDGFRTSHEVMKLESLSDDTIKSLMNQNLVEENFGRRLTPDAPVMRGTAQNPDVYFQGRESVNPFYAVTPEIIQDYMDQFAELTGRKHSLVEYYGAEDADRVVVLMGSGAQTAINAAKYLSSKGEKVGVVNIHLYRPFPTQQVLDVLPKTVKTIAVLDRCKEPGSIGEPLFLDVCQAISEDVMNGNRAVLPRLVGGRYGLSSKEFTPAMVKAIFSELSKENPKSRFTIGINDDVSHTSIEWDDDWEIPYNGFQGLFYGLGSDGTVGANKNSIKIIGLNTENSAQGYFVYDSKKAGSMTVSHLRFGKEQFEAPYLIKKADFIACHHTPHLEVVDMLKNAKNGATFLLNTVESKETVWDSLPKLVQEHILAKKLKFYIIDGIKVGRESGMGRRINTVMQTCFFAISNILSKEESIAQIKNAIKKSYSKKGDDIVQLNYKAVDMSVENLHEVSIPDAVTSSKGFRDAIVGNAPDFVEKFTAEIIAGNGNNIPVSGMPVDGTFPTATSKYEKRDIAIEIPIWDEDICIQCAKCAVVCPHAAIRAKVTDNTKVEVGAPQGFQAIPAKGIKVEGAPMFMIQVSPYDCTGCGVCVEACPATSKTDKSHKAINMEDIANHHVAESAKWDHFIELPDVDRKVLKRQTVKGSQLMQPLFEFSGACSGCGETAYVKLVTQLFGDRSLIANATGCSSIYGGNLPTTPYAKNPEGRGPAWSNSLFEDNAEFGLGFRLAVDKHVEIAEQKLAALAGQLDSELVIAIRDQEQSTEEGLEIQRENVEKLKVALKTIDSDDARILLRMADYLVKKSVWIFGGDGWAYDIGYGGLDHVLASGENVNVLVLDTEVYSNTGGQSSKSSPLGAVAKFAAGGKPSAKKDLGLIAMSYKNVYVGRIAIGQNDMHTVKTLLEAEAYDGPSLILAYSPCIEHGYELGASLEHQKQAVLSGYWPLMRYNPDLAEQGKNPLTLDSKEPSIPVKQYIYSENRFKMLTKQDPETAERLAELLQKQVDDTWKFYSKMAQD